MESRFVAAGAIAALVTLMTILTLRRMAPKVGLVDRPDERKWHRGRIPLVGGLCFFFGMVVGLAYFGEMSPFLVGLLATAGLIFLTGLIDDMDNLSAGTRLLVQAGATGMVIATSGIYVDGLGQFFGSELRLHAFGIVFTIIAVTGLVNAFNMLDGLDGLAGSLAMVSIVSILAFSDTGLSTLGVALLLQVLAMALVPYLFVNMGWPDGRKIFMGDAGSTLIGFLLAWSLVYLSHRQVGQLAPVDVLWCIAIPVMDIVAVVYRRARARCSVLKPDRRHLHHLLLDAGCSPGKALAVIVATGSFMAALGYVLRHVADTTNLVVFLVVLAAYVHFLPAALGHLRRRRQGAAPPGVRPRLQAGTAADTDAAAVPGPAQPSSLHVSRALCVLSASMDDVAVALVMQQLSRDERFDIRVCTCVAPSESTAQVLRLFGIRPDFELNLDVDKSNRDADKTTQAALGRIKHVLRDFKPDVVLAHGDTPAILATALAACYEQVPLVCMDTWKPDHGHARHQPNEASRRLIGTLASLHIASTERSGRHLVSAGIPEDRVTIAGNAAVDTLRTVVRKITQDSDVRRDLALRFPYLREANPLLLAINRATRGRGARPLDHALRTLARQRPDLDIVYCTHRAPAACATASPRRKPANIHLLPPQDYLGFAYLLNSAYIVLANSRDDCAEASALNKPVLIIGDGDANADPAGTGLHSVIGDEREIVECVLTLLSDTHACDAIRVASGQAGDGTGTGLHIAEVLANMPPAQRARSLAA